MYTNLKHEVSLNRFQEVYKFKSVLNKKKIKSFCHQRI